MHITYIKIYFTKILVQLQKKEKMNNKKMHNKISIRLIQTQACIIQFIFTNITFEPVCTFHCKNEFDLRMIDYLAKLRFH